ncbi:hypothetical protein J7T55_009181 [Diaporthe amygdali]|uniref:uncharacterized protein n=1 Tax=Phomopsis amygdali TaxID=1214568 RepID=UPI0022FF1E66|nr:uncharacterized protein J7T55_009181 [Diaporthe amygdali]KAJ0118398.1 hypothetical protein J7T55_009181 [Diaporthe amygdali]
MPHPRYSCDDDACSAAPPASTTTFGMILSLTPFILTFALVSAAVSKKLLPRLSRAAVARDGEDHFLPASAPPSLQQVHSEHGSKSLRRRLAAATVAATIGLATVLGELILAEISDVVSARARDAALRLVVPTLLLLLVGVIPFLEIQSVLAGSGLCSFQRNAKGRFPRWAWTLQSVGFGLWLFVFWSIGKAVPAGHSSDEGIYSRSARGRGTFDATGMSLGLRWTEGVTLPWTVDTVARACLERIGIIGISLMALLSGFASVSSPYSMLADSTTRRKKPITDADIARKQAGLEATGELLVTKRHRLRSLQRKQAATTDSNANAGSSGVMGKIVGSLKGIGTGGDAAEIKALQMEISGLETMESNLSSALSSLRSKQAAQARAGTAWGRLLTIPAYIFSIYCVYRIMATSLTSFRRLYYPASASFSSSDPINRFLGLLAKHWDPKLDQIAWARQISFLLSGVILIASANAVVQTFHIFAKWAPGLLHQAQANLALLIGQTSATYVISAGLLLRSNLPKDMGSAVGHALESALEPTFVDRWFEAWFLLSSLATAVGIWVGRRIHGVGGLGGEWDEWDEFAGEEMAQKRS